MIENFNYKIYKTEIENNEMIILKDRHVQNNKIYGLDRYAPKGIYIYYNPESSNPKYIIWNSCEIYTTNNEKIFWKKLNRDTPSKVSEEEIYLINFCSQDIISRKSGQKIPKIANLQYYKSKANYGTKKKGISR